MYTPKDEKSEIVRLFCQGMDEIAPSNSIKDLLSIIFIAQTNKEVREIFDENQ